MKRLFWLPLLVACLCGADAKPRVGLHEGFTRLAFDLPGTSSVKVSQRGNSASVQLGLKLSAERGSVDSQDVVDYRVSAADGGSTLTLTLAGGRGIKAFVLPAGDGAPPRLVVDVSAGLAKSAPSPQADAKPSRAQSVDPKPAAPTVTPASTRAPGAPRLRVVLDAGHGGVDSGMVGYVVEKETTLAVALKVRQRLVSKGIVVEMTRDRDTQLSLDKRTDLGLRAKMANAGTVNAFVSIHVNAASPSAQGIETWVFGKPIEQRDRALAVRENGGGNLGELLTRESSGLTENLLGDLLSQSNLAYSRKLAGLVQGKLVTATGAVNRGVGSTSFVVIRKPRTPAILVEIGFGSHPVEGRRLAQNVYRERLAEAIADGICTFFNVR